MTTAQSDESRFREGTRLHGQQNRGVEIPSQEEMQAEAPDRERERKRESESIRIGIFAGDAVVRKSTSFFLFAPSPQV
jgi:hypothetical protein